MSTHESKQGAVSTPPRREADGDVTARDISRILRMIRPSFRSDGGDVELVDVNDRNVVIRLTGACAGCPISFPESAGVIERIMRSRLPQISELTVV
jgi:Fe-S cluster biogenesis protein NfuA